MRAIEFGDGAEVEDVVIWSLKRDGTLVSMEARSEAAASAGRGREQVGDHVGQRVYALLTERCQMTRSELGEALSPGVAKRTLDRVLKFDGEGRWTNPRRGIYEVAEVSA